MRISQDDAKAFNENVHDSAQMRDGRIHYNVQMIHTFNRDVILSK